jgi:RNA polymerase sigma-70 factor (ECF subfamily)
MASAKPSPAEAVLGREAVLASLRERMIAFAASRLSRDLAEDLTQEVLLLLHEKYPDVTRAEDLVPLSLQILRFKIMGARRKANRHGEYSQVPADEFPLADGRPGPETEFARRETLERLEKALEEMGGRCRELFRLKLEGKGFQEIKELMGAASINTVYTWDFRCRQRLLELMGGAWEAGK